MRFFGFPWFCFGFPCILLGCHQVFYGSPFVPLCFLELFCVFPKFSSGFHRFPIGFPTFLFGSPLVVLSFLCFFEVVLTFPLIPFDFHRFLFTAMLIFMDFMTLSLKFIDVD